MEKRINRRIAIHDIANDNNCPWVDIFRDENDIARNKGHDNIVINLICSANDGMGKSSLFLFYFRGTRYVINSIINSEITIDGKHDKYYYNSANGISNWTLGICEIVIMEKKSQMKKKSLYRYIVQALFHAKN